jgi:hypothetical protein
LLAFRLAFFLVFRLAVFFFAGPAIIASIRVTVVTIQSIS